MKNFLRVSVFILVLSGFLQAYGQYPGCASVNTLSKVVIPCGQTCATIHANAFGGAQTTSYAVDSLGYAPPFSFNTGTQVLAGATDLWSNAISLPFDFCFFGYEYNQIVIGSNGVVSFNASNANSFNNWAISAPAPFNNPADLTNAIMAPWQSLNDSSQGRVYYQIGGSEPCRYVVISWNDVPLYSSLEDPCDSVGNQTSMVVLYETSNIIDVYIHEKSYCPEWNNGWAIEGIQNAAGTVAYTVPGRNATKWNATNSAYRFLPTGAPNYIVSWIEANNQIAVGDSVTVCPAVPTYFTARATITRCDSSTINTFATVFVTFQKPFITIDSIHQPSCHGNDGAIFASFDSTPGITSYGWNTAGGAGHTSITNLGAGTYIFTVKDSFGCNTSDTVKLTATPPLVVTVPNDIVASCHPTTIVGTLTADTSGGAPPFTYKWSDSLTTKTITGLSSGTYYVTVTDQNGCTVSASGIVSVNMVQPSISGQIMNASPCGDSATGGIIAQVSNSTPPETYTWSPVPSNTDSIEHVPAGNYNVSITDANGCTASATLMIGTNPPLAIDSATIVPISCSCSPSASIKIYVTGGDTAYKYNWSNGETSNPDTNLSAGSYTVTVTDKGGCTATAYYIIGHSPCSPCASISTNNNVSVPCGQTCTTLSASATGANQTTSYTGSSICYAPPAPFDTGIESYVDEDDVWSDTITIPFNFCFFGHVYNQLIIGANGVVSFNVSNANAVNSWYIDPATPAPFNNPADITNSIMSPWQDLDPTLAGKITYVTIGAPPCEKFVINWNHVPMYGDPKSIDTQYCTLVDTQTQQIVLYQTTNIIDINIKHKSFICNNLNYVDTPYSPGGYWDGGLATEGIQNAAGTVAYTVAGRNATQWSTDSDSYRFTPSGPPDDTIYWYHGDTLIATGDTVRVCPPMPTNYTVKAIYTICDNSTVTIQDSVHVIPGGSITVNIDSIHNVTCAGNNGALFASFSVQAYGVDSFGWTPGGKNDTSITNLPPGTYTFSVTTTSGCTKSVSVTLVAPPVISLSLPNDSIFSCSSGSAPDTGILTAHVTGGTPPFAYHWNNDSTTQSIKNLGQGTYSVTVTDSLACTASATAQVLLIISPTIIFHPPFITNVTCNGGNNGAIGLVVTGGLPPLTYQWSNGMAGDSITGLTAGTYHVTATDAHGCSDTASYTVTQPNPITDSTIVVKAACIGGGSIDVIPGGGVPPYTYNWAGGQTDSMIHTPAPGTYTVTITDSKGCKLVANIFDSAASPLPFFGPPQLVEPLCKGQSNGSITAHGEGGTGTIHYLWSPQPDTTATITGLSSGTYSVTITDSLGCTADTSYILAQPAAITFAASIVHNISCFGFNNGSITAVATGGTGNITYQWNYQNATTATISNLAPGPYTVTATDANGCKADTTFMITQPAALAIIDSTITGAGCTVGGSIYIIVTGGTGSDTYVWSNTGETGDSIDNLSPNTYTVTITDQNSCSLTASFVVAPSGDVMTIDSATITDLTCYESGNGSITVYAHHTVPGAIFYAWSNGATTRTIINLAAGTYSVTASDAGGCTASAQYNVTQPPQLLISISYTPYVCLDMSNGKAMANVTGGSPPYTYLWSNTSTSDSVSNLPVGQFSVTVTDANNCTATAVETIRQDEFSAATSAVEPFKCARPPYGDVTITPQQGVSPYIYFVEGIGAQHTGQFDNVPPGTYAYEVTDSAGCTATGDFIVPPGFLPDSFGITSDSTTCYGFHDGSATLIPINNYYPPNTYSINGGPWQSSIVFDSLGAGDYQAVVRDSVGCLDTVYTTVYQPSQLLVSFSPDTIIGVINTDTVQLIPIISSNFVSPLYNWSPSQGLSCTTCPTTYAYIYEPALSPPVVYYVQVSDSLNPSCIAIDSIFILIKGQFAMPTAFTPGVGGKNSLFGPVSYSYLTITVFHIYNRWGAMVHDGNTYWDGNFKGKEQPPGTYVYYIEVEYPDPLTGANVTGKKEGSVVLLR